MKRENPRKTNHTISRNIINGTQLNIFNSLIGQMKHRYIELVVLTLFKDSSEYKRWFLGVSIKKEHAFVTSNNYFQATICPILFERGSAQKFVLSMFFHLV